jgi:hypothetical protein
MSNQPLPDDYDANDGFDEDYGVEQCPHCEKLFTPNGGHTGPVFDQRGREYDCHLDTNPGDGPFFCPTCWHNLEANRNASNHRQLTEFQ